MIQPVIHDYLTQIFVKHYKMQAKAAAEEAIRFLEILELYDVQLIKGDWVPEPAPEQQESRDPFFGVGGKELRVIKETLLREPWNSPELKQ